MWDKTLKVTATVFFASILCVSLGFAQEKTVEGTVTEAATGQPLPGANVSVQGAQTGTATNTQGEYELTVPGPDAVLVFNFVGFQSQEVRVGDRTVIDVALQEQVAELDEVVVTGYSQQRRESITGSVSEVDVADANVGQQSSPQDLLQGRISGVNVQDNSGEPGAGQSVNIRGTSSITGSNDPLYVVDGVPIANTNVTPGGSQSGGVTSSNSSNPLAMLNSGDIESVRVLKDAAATSIYGSEGANGVIVIETKGGSAERLSVSYSGQSSVSTFGNELDLVSGERFASAVEEFTDQTVESVAGTDWQDAATRTAVSHEQNLSVSGGLENTTFRASLGFSRRNGILLENGIERINGTLSVRHSEFDDRLRFNVKTTVTNSTREHGFFNQAGGFEGGALKGMIGFSGIQPIVNDSTGEFNEFSSSIKNPVALQERITDVTDQNRIVGSFGVEADVLENLTAKSRVGLDLSSGVRRTGIPGSGPPLWVGQNTGGLGSQSRRELSNVVSSTTLEYDTNFLENHSIQALGGFEYERETWQTVRTSSENFIDDVTLFNNLAGGASVQTPTSSKLLAEQVGFLGRVNYNFNDKYLITGTFRRDGSSVFGENNNFAWFPSVSAGWNLHRESFLEDLSWLGQLKLRGTWGETGNQAVPPLQTKAVLAADEGFRGVFGEGENVQTGVAPRRAPDPDLQWEETTEFTVGLDYTIGRFDGTIEYYTKNTEELLLEVPTVPPSVATTRLTNLGEVDNSGIEASVNASVINREEMSLDLGANISSNNNEVVSLGREFIDHTPVSGAGQTGVDAQRLEPGHPIGSFHGPVFTGINEDGQETYRTPDGETTTNLSEAERTHIGNPIPTFQYGLQVNFRYQNFDVSTFLRGEQGQDVFNNTALEFATKSNLGRGIQVLETALEDGTSSDHVPVFSSRWIEDASYFRMDNVTLGYTVPGVDRFRLQNLRVYTTIQNVFVITGYDGFDPEVNTNVTGKGLGFRDAGLPSPGVDYTSYPRSRTFTFGVDMTF